MTTTIHNRPLVFIPNEPPGAIHYYHPRNKVYCIIGLWSERLLLGDKPKPEAANFMKCAHLRCISSEMH